jgi:hypothetical protein
MRGVMPKSSPPKPKATPKLTDEERYKRFLDAAKEVGASEDPKDFERAFHAVTRRPVVRKDRNA